MLEQQYKVLVKEKIADSGVNMLRERFAVDVGVDWTDEELAERIGGYHGILIRSATQLTAELIGRADNLRVIGRAGIGVDNVDVEAATKRGIIVANAPQSNIVAAAEHTVALMLSLARNIPQAHASLTAGKWERSKFGGVEVYEKTLGVLGFGRIGQLVAARAQGFGMRVLAFDPFVSSERFRELGVEQGRDERRRLPRVRLHHHPPAQDARDARLARRRGVRADEGRRPRHQLRPRRAARRRGAQGRARLRQGRRRGARRLPGRADHRLPAVRRLRQRRRHPAPRRLDHRGPGPRRRPDRRAGRRRAHRRRRLHRGQHPRRLARRTWRCSARTCRSCSASAASPSRSPRASIDRVECEYLGHLAERDTRLLTLATLNGVLAGHTEEEVNLVNAPSLAEERGIEVAETKELVARDFTDLVRITSSAARAPASSARRSASSTARTCSRPGASASTSSSTTTTSRSSATPTCPGMVGRVGTAFGEHGINISQAAVGRQPPGEDGHRDNVAVMAVTTDAPVPQALVDQIAASDGFIAGRAVSL